MTTGIESTFGQTAVNPFVWEFRTTVAPFTGGLFRDSGQSIGGITDSDGVALGDLDGDGDLDAFIVNNLASNEVWLNDGMGKFDDSGQRLGDNSLFMYSVVLGDLDGDGDLDAFVPVGNGPSQVWFNDGAGSFPDSISLLEDLQSADIALGDLDGDGDLDAFVANLYKREGYFFYKYFGNRIWINDGVGNFTDTGENVGLFDTFGVALGDLDNDGDLDAYTANYCSEYQPNYDPERTKNKVFLNNGDGTFTEMEEEMGSDLSFDVALGDLDGDGDVDALVTNEFSGDQVWVNDGMGLFTNSEQSFGGPHSIHCALGDVDGDGDLDAVIADFDEGSRVWRNNGTGLFDDSGQLLGGINSVHPVLGDLDGDGKLDLFVGNDTGSNKVYLQTNCESDSDFDGDVDGTDLAALCADPARLDLAVFAGEFGGEGC